MSWPRPLLFGHRGAPATGLPENTMASFSRALADGAEALETDVHRTRDGHVVVAHDPFFPGENITRAAAATSVEPRAIRETTLAELRAVDLGAGERIPLLREVLDRFPGVPVNVDIKQAEPAIERDVIEAIGSDHERVLLASFNADVLSRARALYRGPTGLSRDEVVRLWATPTVFARAWRIGGKRAQVPRARGRIRFDTPSFIAKCHQRGVLVDFWVINDADEAGHLLALGADGIMSDAPGAVRGAFA